MPEEKNKQKLIQFLERRAWNPVLKASPDRYPESERKRLQLVQRKTESQRERYEAYESAGEVRQRFEEDLHSQPAKKVNADLKKLNLPVQPDVAEDFFALADRLGVGPGRQARRPHKPHPPHPWHKSKPEEREKAKQELTRQARAGDKAAVETLQTSPRKWARDYAAKLTGTKSTRKRTSAKRSATSSRKKQH